MDLKGLNIRYSIVFNRIKRELNGLLGELNSLVALILGLTSVIMTIWNLRKINKKLGKYEPFVDDMADLLKMEETPEGLVVDHRLTLLAAELAKAIGQTIKMSFLGNLSGQARLDKGLKGAMTQDIIDEKMPIINLAGDFLGINTKAYIKKHPDALAQIMQIAGPYLQKFQGGGNDGGQMRQGRGRNVPVM